MRLFRRFLGPRKQPPGLSWLTDDLAVCAAPSDSQWPSILAAGVRSVVDLRAEGTDNQSLMEAYGLRYLRMPVEEWRAPSDAELRLVTQWIAERIQAGPVLVHCREGRGRSAMVACAALVSLGLPLKDAYQLLLRVRPQAALSDEQTGLLERFAEESRHSR